MIARNSPALRLLCGVVALLSLTVACSNVEQGTGQALGNIGSAINHESKKVWIEPGEKKAQNAKEEQKEDARHY